MTVASLGITSVVLLAALAAPAAQEKPAAPGPETFHVQATVPLKGRAGTGTAKVDMTIRIDRYTPDHAATTMTDALKYGGYPGFLKALREAPQAGALEVAGDSYTIRWARQDQADGGRTITLVTDQPVYFIGAGKPGAKSTKGYEVAVAKLVMQPSGTGEGTMAAAARVKPLNVTGVQIDSYTEEPVKLAVTVQK